MKDEVMTEGEIEEASVSQLVSAVAETESYAFLVGAGTSKPEPAGIPLAGELVEKWQKERYEIEDPETDFEEWINEKEDENDVKENEQYGFWFQERHRTSGERREFIQDLVKNAPPTPGHVILASLMSDGGNRNYVPVTLTTNFDDLLFDSFYRYLEDKPQVVDHGDIAGEFKLTRDQPVIVKLHGHYSYSNLQNTEDETESLDSGMERILERTVGEFGLVVLGYGGEEASVMDTLNDAEISEYGIYWCTRNPHDLSEDVKKLLKGNQDAYAVPIDGFVNVMSQFAREIDNVEPPTRQELLERAEERANRLEQVVEESQEAADDNAEYLSRWRKRSVALDAFESGDYEKTVELFSELTESGPERAIDYSNRGAAKTKLGNYEDAIEDYNQAVELDSEFPVVFQNRAETKLRIGDFEGALQDAEEAESLSSTRTEKVVSLLLYLIAATVVNTDAEAKEEEYRNLCEKSTSNWSLEELDSWLETADLESKKHEHIEELLDLFREHKE